LALFAGNTRRPWCTEVRYVGERSPDYRGATMALHSTVGFGFAAAGGWAVDVALAFGGGMTAVVSWAPALVVRAAGGLTGTCCALVVGPAIVLPHYRNWCARAADGLRTPVYELIRNACFWHIASAGRAGSPCGDGRLAGRLPRRAPLSNPVLPRQASHTAQFPPCSHRIAPPAKGQVRQLDNASPVAPRIVPIRTPFIQIDFVLQRIIGPVSATLS
jgi:hypothetical protein